MKAKRITAILIALTLTAALTACGESNIELAQADTQSEVESEYLEDLAEDEDLAEGEDLTEDEDLAEDEDPVKDEDLAEDEVLEEDEVLAEEVDYEVEDIEAVTMYASTSVSLRTGPSTDYEKVGSLSTNEAVTVTGVADTGWYRLNYKDTEVYVSNKYVQDTKVVSTASTSTASTTSTSTDASSMFDDSDIPWATPVSDEELAALVASGVPVYTSGSGSSSSSGSNSGSNSGSSSGSNSGSDSGSNSGSNGGSNSGSTTAHEHSWKAHTVVVDDYETKTEKVAYCECVGCGVRFEGYDDCKAHQLANATRDNDCARTKTVYDYVTTQVKVGSHEEVDYYYCDCGATK